MKVIIKKARIRDAKDCLECIKQSLLWDAYYKDNQSIDLIKEAIKRKEIYIALNSNNTCIGFMGVIEKGCFGNFPYLAILSVHKKYRSKGIGKQLLEKFEKIGLKKADRVFVLCSDFNTQAQKFYKNNEYEECGLIKNLYKNGIAEHLFVKYQL